jgi:hypothetical protein
VDYDGSDLEEYEDDEDNESRFEGEEYSYSVSSEADPEPDVRPRKRSSDVLYEEEEEEDTADTNTSDSASLRRQETGGTPPKRARIGVSDPDHDDNNNDAALTIRPIPSPARQKKRSSEELEEGDVATGNKRAKLDKSSPVFESPIGLEADRFEGDSLPSTVDEDDSCNPSLARGPILHRRISKADIDKLIPLDDLED